MAINLKSRATSKRIKNFSNKLYKTNARRYSVWNLWLLQCSGNRILEIAIKEHQKEFVQRPIYFKVSMKTLLNNSSPLTEHVKPSINDSMNSRQNCPCCSRLLLRHMRLGGLYWRCSSCYDAMPVL
jgi:hypothetical protein